MPPDNNNRMNQEVNHQIKDKSRKDCNDSWSMVHSHKFDEDLASVMKNRTLSRRSSNKFHKSELKSRYRSMPTRTSVARTGESKEELSSQVNASFLKISISKKEKDSVNSSALLNDNISIATSCNKSISSYAVTSDNFSIATSKKSMNSYAVPSDNVSIATSYKRFNLSMKSGNNFRDYENQNKTSYNTKINVAPPKLVLKTNKSLPQHGCAINSKKGLKTKRSISMPQILNRKGGTEAGNTEGSKGNATFVKDSLRKLDSPNFMKKENTKKSNEASFAHVQKKFEKVTETNSIATPVKKISNGTGEQLKKKYDQLRKTLSGKHLSSKENQPNQQKTSGNADWYQTNQQKKLQNPFLRNSSSPSETSKESKRETLSLRNAKQVKVKTDFNPPFLLRSSLETIRED